MNCCSQGRCRRAVTPFRSGPTFTPLPNVWQAVQRWLKTFLASTVALARPDQRAQNASAANANVTRIDRASVVRRQQPTPGDVGSDGVPCWQSTTSISVFPKAELPSNALFFRETVIVISPGTATFMRSDVGQLLTCPYCQQESAQRAGGLLPVATGISARRPRAN